MIRFLFARFGRFLLTILLICTIVFFVLRILPGDPSRIIGGMDASQDVIETIKAKLGTDKPVLVQYFNWMGGIARIDLGKSFISSEPVARLILKRLPVTFLLAIGGMLTALVIALPAGVISAVKRWTWIDYFGMVMTQAGMAIPSFWLGILLLLFFSVLLPLFPLFGYETPAHFVLPVLALGLPRAAMLTRITRIAMIEELSREYILSARANGLPECAVLFRHGLRNAFLSILTVSGIQFGYLLGGAIVVESLFSIPGLGRLLLTAINQRDFPVVQGTVVCIAAAFSAVNFLVDSLYAVVNPKVRK